MLNEKKILIIDQNKIDIQIIKLLLNTCNVVSFKGGDTKIINLIKR